MVVMAGERKEGHGHLLNAESVSWSSPEKNPQNPNPNPWPSVAVGVRGGLPAPSPTPPALPHGDGGSPEPPTCHAEFKHLFPIRLTGLGALLRASAVTPLTAKSRSYNQLYLAFTNFPLIARDSRLGQAGACKTRGLRPHWFKFCFPSCPWHPLHMVGDPLSYSRNLFSFTSSQELRDLQRLHCSEHPGKGRMDLRNCTLTRFRKDCVVALKAAFIITTSSSNAVAEAGLTCGGACTSRSGGLPSSGTRRRSCTARRTPRAPGTPAEEANTRAQSSSPHGGGAKREQLWVLLRCFASSNTPMVHKLICCNVHGVSQEEEILGTDS